MVLKILIEMVDKGEIDKTVVALVQNSFDQIQQLKNDYLYLFNTNYGQVLEHYTQYYFNDADSLMQNIETQNNDENLEELEVIEAYISED